jgi:hypothetical protein
VAYVFFELPFSFCSAPKEGWVHRPGGVTIQPCPSCKQTNADKINALKRRTRDFMGQPRSSDDDVQTSYLESTDNYEYDMLAIARLIAR